MKQLFLGFLFVVSFQARAADLEDPKISEGLTQNEVQTVVKEKLNNIRHCYEKVLQKSPQAKGKMTVDFKIDAAGKVGDSKISSETVGNPAMSECVLKNVSQWKFPKPKNGKTVDVSYPFAFEPL